jgi:hypothetical protein
LDSIPGRHLRQDKKITNLRPAILNPYKSFLTNRNNEIQYGTITHKQRVTKPMMVPIPDPKNSLNIAPYNPAWQIHPIAG